MQKGTFRYFGEAVLAMIFWSLSFIWIKIAYRGYLPITTIFLRVVIAGMALLLIGLLSGKLQKPKRKDAGLFLLLGFFEPFIYFLGESFGLVYLSPTTAAVIISTVPLLTPFLAGIFFREKTSLTNQIGLAISFIGTLWLLTGFSFHLSSSPRGISLEFLAVLSTLGFSVCLKKLTGKYNNFSIICYQNLVGIVLFLPLWLTLEAHRTFQNPLNLPAFEAILELAVFATILAFFFFTDSIRHLGINRTNLFSNLIPICVALFAHYLLHEQFTIQQIAGILLVIAGLFVACSKPKSIAIANSNSKTRLFLLFHLRKNVNKKIRKI